MIQNTAQQRKQFTVPSRDELIQQIKQLDEQIEHVTLNLIKCDFNATQKDVEKSFPDINFVKVKNYNPGSFQVVLEMKIDAINFIRNHYDKKILNRRFFIKLGRQQKQLVEDWTGVGFVPKTFKAPFTKGPHANKKQLYNKNKKIQSQTEDKNEYKSEEKIHEPSELKETPKQETKPDQKQEQTRTEQKKQGKHIPKRDYQKKPYTKKAYNKIQNQKTEQVPSDAKNQSHKKQETIKAKQERKQTKPAPVETKPEPKEEDDGWIVVSKKTTGKKK